MQCTSSPKQTISCPPGSERQGYGGTRSEHTPCDVRVGKATLTSVAAALVVAAVVRTEAGAMEATTTAVGAATAAGSAD